MGVRRVVQEGSGSASVESKGVISFSTQSPAFGFSIQPLLALPQNTQLAQEISFSAHAELVGESQGNPYMGNRLQ